MENEDFDQFEFENLLIEEFFNCNEVPEITSLINKQLKENEEFAMNYERWLEESGFSGWKEFYRGLEDEESSAWSSMYPEGEDE